MKNKPYRIKLFKLATYFVFIVILGFIACQEDSSDITYPNPTIRIIEKTGYLSKDTILSVGDNVIVGIEAQYNGHNKLVNFIAKRNGENYMDIGMYAEELVKEVEIQKGLDDIEDWGFIIRDFKGNQSSVELTIEKDPNIVYGEISEYLNVQLGAQNSTEYGSFLSFSNGMVYNIQDAYNNQELIDMLYFYDNFDALEENIIASPGANLTSVYSGEYDVNNWEIKNTTRYSRDELDIVEDEFDAANNDSILIAHSFSFESGGRKTKFLKAGDIYSFVRDGKTGMFKVVSTTGETEGNIIVDIKIQK